MNHYTKHILLICCLFMNKAFSQDIIMKQDLENIESKVIEITPSEVKYKKFKNLEGPLITILKSEVKMIKYENGDLEEFKANITTPSINMSKKGKNDAINNYSCVKCGATGTTITSILSPILGLIPAIATSATFPHDSNLNEPNSELMKNSAYKMSYNRQAKKIKQKKIWLGWGVGLGVNLVLSIVMRGTQ
jgi:hypothetical protein